MTEHRNHLERIDNHADDVLKNVPPRPVPASPEADTWSRPASWVIFAFGAAVLFFVTAFVLAVMAYSGSSSAFAQPSVSLVAAGIGGLCTIAGAHMRRK